MKGENEKDNGETYLMPAICFNEFLFLPMSSLVPPLVLLFPR